MEDTQCILLIQKFQGRRCGVFCEGTTMSVFISEATRQGRWIEQSRSNILDVMSITEGVRKDKVPQIPWLSLTSST